jgi:nanoRNase/pAp phosphatase (c-di-AMP/oligoRNAs hydrolase)
VVFFDVADSNVGAFNKFITYYLFPEARYSVGLTGSGRAKISIGSNPWSKVPRTHEINKICERYGGGGHPVVGAVTLPRADLERARTIAAEVVAELQK